MVGSWSRGRTGGWSARVGIAAATTTITTTGVGLRSCASAKIHERAFSDRFHVLSWVLKCEITALFCRTARLRDWDVCDCHVGKSIKCGCIVGTTRNRNRRTVHVHLAISNLVEPRPRRCHDAVGKLRRNGELEGIVEARTLFIQIGFCRDRTAALNGVDDFPLGILGRFLVGGDADLA